MIDIPGASSPTASWIVHFSAQYMSKRKVWTQCFQVNRAAAVTCRNKGGVGRVRGCLIQRRSSFQSLLCTAAHLDADARRTANVCRARPPHWGAEGLGTKVGCIYVSSNFFFFGWGFGTLQWFRLSSNFILGDSVSSSPLSLQFPSQSTKIQVEYREAPTTPLTLRLPLRSLNLNWPNELAIGEALVTAYWCVHACVHARTHTPLPGFVKSIVTIRSCLWLSAFFPLSPVSLHFCPTTSFSQSTPKSNKLLHRHWSFSHPNICIRKKNRHEDERPCETESSIHFHGERERLMGRSGFIEFGSALTL